MPKQPQPCGCGCGGMTKGGRFLPGHDARFHAAQKTGRLAGAIAAHTSGAHGTAAAAPARSSGYPGPVVDEKPGDAAPVGEGTMTEKGTRVAPGMWLRATISGKPREGIVFNVDPYGNIAFMDEAGQQWMGYTGQSWVVDTNVKRKPNPAQRAALVKIGREVPGMQTGGK